MFPGILILNFIIIFHSHETSYLILVIWVRNSEFLDQIPLPWNGKFDKYGMCPVYVKFCKNSFLGNTIFGKPFWKSHEMQSLYWGFSSLRFLKNCCVTTINCLYQITPYVTSHIGPSSPYGLCKSQLLPISMNTHINISFVHARL
jgi:hypothetical protein